MSRDMTHLQFECWHKDLLEWGDRLQYDLLLRLEGHPLREPITEERLCRGSELRTELETCSNPQNVFYVAGIQREPDAWKHPEAISWLTDLLIDLKLELVNEPLRHEFTLSRLKEWQTHRRDLQTCRRKIGFDMGTTHR